VPVGDVFAGVLLPPLLNDVGQERDPGTEDERRPGYLDRELVGLRKYPASATTVGCKLPEGIKSLVIWQRLHCPAERHKTRNMGRYQIPFHLGQLTSCKSGIIRIAAQL